MKDNQSTDRTNRLQRQPPSSGRTGDPCPRPVDVSVVVVNYNCGDLLQKCIRALAAETRGLSVELFLIDNGSVDGSFEPACETASKLSERLSASMNGTLSLRALQNHDNLGFARANNEGLRLASGRYRLLLNPDAHLEPGSLRAVVRFMDDHPDVGICGPRVLLPSGKLDAPCRRSFKTPSTYLYKQLGLSKLFPRSRTFGKYYLSYLQEDETTEVDSVIGAFLMIRREAMERVGLLDERYFMYCEDEDWCFRVKQAGWKVMYYPKARVTHHKGSSARQMRSRMVLQFHRSIWQFHQKNMAPSYPALVNALVYAGIGWSLLASVVLAAADGALPGPARNGSSVDPVTTPSRG